MPHTVQSLPADPAAEAENGVQAVAGTSLHNADSTKRNAFDVLLEGQSNIDGVTHKANENRQVHPSFPMGLATYVNNPQGETLSKVIHYNEFFVWIHDLYPKASIHTLVIYRGPETFMHPFEAFDNPVLLAQMREEAAKLRSLVAKDLQRKFGRFSAADQAREKVLNGEVELAEGEEPPRGRDWEQEVSVGVHSKPSMAHLHVHVISVDHYSPGFVNSRRHYNGFKTEVFVPLDSFPLAKDDPRRHLDAWQFYGKDFVCWRCGKNFGNKFKMLKEHLAEEFEEWKKL